MPFTSTPDPIIANLTDLARTNLARVVMGEISFKLKGFSVGREGYDDIDPVKIDLINTSLTILGDQIFPALGNKALELIERPTPSTCVANCRLASTEAVAGLGELGLWAEILDSTIVPEIGTEFLFAVAHFPIMTKTLKQAILYRMIIQF